nr:LysR substrate-binding domain-containing protein [Desulfovibrio sp. Huiquan2017]
MAKGYPGISFVEKKTMSWDAAGELSSRSIDLGFSHFLPDADGIVAQRLGEIELAIAAPEIWRDRVADLDLKGLASFPWVWISDHCPMNKVLSGLFDEIGEEPVKAVVVDQESAWASCPRSRWRASPDAYGIFLVRNLEKTLTLHLLSLECRAEEPMIMTMVNLTRKVWA